MVNSDINSNDTYGQLHRKYKKLAQKENTIQILGFLFVFFSSLIEFIVFVLIRRILQQIKPSLIIRLVLIFVILTIITALAVVQLIIIRKWNKSVVISHQSLAQANYRIIDRMQTIRLIIVIIIGICVVYFRLYLLYRIPRSEEFQVLIRIYRFLLRLSFLSVLAYFIMEITQLIKWSKRIGAVKQIEQRMIQELPGLDELAQLADEDEK